MILLHISIFSMFWLTPSLGYKTSPKCCWEGADYILSLTVKGSYVEMKNAL